MGEESSVRHVADWIWGSAGTGNPRDRTAGDLERLRDIVDAVRLKETASMKKKVAEYL